MKYFLAVLISLPLAASTVRIVQTNSAGDNVSLIDPATNKVVGNIKGIEVNHGAAAAPGGSRYYISNEAQNTLDVVDTRSFEGDQQGFPSAATLTTSRSARVGGVSMSPL
jgi:DNA-binding beta-propeller fold protein YncE